MCPNKPGHIAEIPSEIRLPGSFFWNMQPLSISQIYRLTSPTLVSSIGLEMELCLVFDHLYATILRNYIDAMQLLAIIQKKD